MVELVTKKDLLKYKSIMVKSNYIIEASYKLSLQEQRLIYLLTAKINKSDTYFKPYKFTRSEVSNILSKHNLTFSELSNYIDNLRNKELVIIKENSILKAKWLSSAEYFTDGSFELCFDDKLKPYLLQLKDRFTKLSLDKIITFNSSYSCRIYELLKQYENIKVRTANICDLRNMFCIGEEEYKRYNDFKRKVILQAQKEINTGSDISFAFEELKTGRKVTAIKFTIKSNFQNLSPEEKSKVTIVNLEYEDKVRDIIKSTIGKEISLKSAGEIYKNASLHKDYGSNPLKLIEEISEYSKTQNIGRGIVGWFKKMALSYEKPIAYFKQDTFNNYKQRNYSSEELEELKRKLLGWE